MKTAKPLPAIEILHKYLDYNPETGIFRRRSIDASNNKKRRERNDLRPAGTIVLGYLVISIEKTVYKAHRIAWKMVYEMDPEDEIDHINHDSLDNRIANLRPASRAENMWNVSKRRGNRPYRGVWSEDGRWRARVVVHRKIIDIGSFETAEEANAALISFRNMAHGEYAFHS